MLHTIVLALLLQASPTPPSRAAVCATQEGHAGSDAIVSRSSRIWLCTADSGTLVPIEKKWFHDHCRTFDAANGDLIASCDAPAPALNPATPIAHPAAPSKGKARMKAFGYGAAAAGAVALCVIGGCGFMGGD